MAEIMEVVGLDNLKTFYTELQKKFVLQENNNKKVLYTDDVNNDAVGYTKAEIDDKFDDIQGSSSGGNPLLFINTTGNTNEIFNTIQDNMDNKIIKRRISEADDSAELLDAIFLSPSQAVFSRFYPQQARKHNNNNPEWNPNTYNLGNLSTLNKNAPGNPPTWKFSSIEVVNAQDSIDKIKELDTKIATLEYEISQLKTENSQLKTKISTLESKPHFTKTQIEKIIADYNAAHPQE